MATDEERSLRARIDGLLAARDKAGAVRAALAAVDAGEIGVRALYAGVLSPLMVDVGAAWQAGGTRVWEEHLAAGAVRTIVEALYPTVRRLADAAAPTGRSVLLACPPNEGHDLGLRMLADLFDLAGWRTYLLGPDCPGPEIATAAEALGVDLIVLSSSTHFHRVRVRALLDELHARLPGVRVVVGGPAFARGTRGFSAEETTLPPEVAGDPGSGGEA